MIEHDKAVALREAVQQAKATEADLLNATDDQVLEVAAAYLDARHTLELAIAFGAVELEPDES